MGPTPLKSGLRRCQTNGAGPELGRRAVENAETSLTARVKICRRDFEFQAHLAPEIGECAIDNEMTSPLTSARSGQGKVQAGPSTRDPGTCRRSGGPISDHKWTTIDREIVVFGG